jgi:hypothetical protein
MSVLVSSLNREEYCENLERKMKTCFNILQLSDKYCGIYDSLTAYQIKGLEASVVR